MARRLTEEQVAKSIIRWLVRNGWTIIAFDFPQSGTGRCLHPNDTDSKTDGIWIPDIVAHKGNNLIFFENKDRYVYNDFEKVERLKNTTCYSMAIKEITQGYEYESIHYGIGFPQSPSNISKAASNLDMIEFLVTAIDKDNASVEYDPHHIFAD